jgi:hypothetical protein
VHCPDATASSFFAKVRGEVFAHFHAVTVKRHSSMRNWFLGLPGRMLYRQSSWCQRKCWSCSWLCSSSDSSFFGVSWTEHAIQKMHVLLMLSSPNACSIITRGSIALLPRFAQHLVHTGCRIHNEIASGQIDDCK